MQSDQPPTKKPYETSDEISMVDLSLESSSYERIPQAPKSDPTQKSTNFQLNTKDLDIIKTLDEEYENSLLEREIVWNARYRSVRKNARSSIYFMALFFIIGVIFYELETDWSVSEIILFSVYTITTVGYGNMNSDTPNTALFLLFTILYLFVGIATLTIMAAQLYQWILLEISWAQYSKDKKDLKKKHQESLKASVDIEQPSEYPNLDASNTPRSRKEKLYDDVVHTFSIAQETLKKKSWGPLVAVIVPWSTMILFGALVVGLIENWTIAEALYFAAVSLTTVGYGDYFPTRLGSIWFCIFWLPCSVGFMSLYLGSVAHLYFETSEAKVTKIEKKMRKRFKNLRRKQEEEREQALRRLATGGFDLHVDLDDDESVASFASSFTSTETNQEVPSHISPTKKCRSGRRKEFQEVPVLSPSSESHEQMISDRREAVLMNSLSTETAENDEKVPHQAAVERPKTMRTLKETIKAVKLNMSSSRRTQAEQDSMSSPSVTAPNNTPLSLQSTKHYNTADGIEKKPTFALRVLVQERVAEIIAHEIAGYQSNLEIKENTLSVTIDTLKETTDKWLIPKRAKKAFRAVAFEALYFVGERDLIVLGPDAIFNLKPSEVQGMFGPFLAALGDADTMEVWLSRTDTKALNELKHYESNSTTSTKDSTTSQSLTQEQLLKLQKIQHNRARKVTSSLTTRPSISKRVIGNAFSS